MASCGSVVMTKTHNSDSEESIREYGTVIYQRVPSVDLDSHDCPLTQIRETGRLRERGTLKLRNANYDAGPSNIDDNMKDFYDCLHRRHLNLSGSDHEDYSNTEAEANNAEVETFPPMIHEDLLELEIDEELEVLDILGPESSRNHKKVLLPASNYPCGPDIVDKCLVCFEKTKLRKRLCCDFAVCDECMEKYLTIEVERGTVKIGCISGNCDSYVHRDEILERLPVEIKDKFYRFLIDANKDPNIKTCPRCSNIYNRNENGVVQNYGKYGVKVECPDCKLDWCFECQAPWHANIKCKDFRKGNKLLKSWAKERHFGNPNAQRCPKCKIFIERTDGCDHMTCTKCKTNFCYRCGDRMVSLKLFGNHQSRLSPLGCKYKYKPDEPVKRRLVRGSLLGAKLLGGVFLVGLGLAAGAILVGASVVILPVLGGIKYHRNRRIRREIPRFICGLQEEAYAYEPDEWEVDRDKVELIRELGRGLFGMVYEGIVHNLAADKDEVRVAVKTTNVISDYDKHLFLQDISIMKSFNCHHVVQLIGVVSNGQPAYVLMELMANGDLKNFLRQHRPDGKDYDGRQPPTLKQILQMAGEIADGMAYLAEKKYVHRDLAARNCMVGEDMTVKIGNFGTSRYMFETDYHWPEHRGLLPVRWMAPESLKDGVFTCLSDVWSYGVILWEMVTLAAQPYQGLSNEEVMEYVTSGNIMDAPEGCPPKLYNLMVNCWKFRMKQRPTFKDIIEYLLPDLDKKFEEFSYFFNPERYNLEDYLHVTHLVEDS